MTKDEIFGKKPKDNVKWIVQDLMKIDTSRVKVRMFKKLLEPKINKIIYFPKDGSHWSYYK